MSGEHSPQGFGVDPPSIQRRVKAAPAATMRRFEAQVNGRRGGIRGEEGVGELEEGVGPAVEASVERAAEGAESIRRFHDVPIMHSPSASRTPYPAPQLKRKLRDCLKSPDRYRTGTAPRGRTRPKVPPFAVLRYQRPTIEASTTTFQTVSRNRLK